MGREFLDKLAEQDVQVQNMSGRSFGRLGGYRVRCRYRRPSSTLIFTYSKTERSARRMAPVRASRDHSQLFRIDSETHPIPTPLFYSSNISIPKKDNS